MPVYNGERFIRQALDSLLAQNYENFELIILDNASTDLTVEICKGYAIKDERIRYYRNEQNMGGTFSLKHLLDLAMGKYFMWAAHDDIWHPDFITSCVGMLERNKNAGMAFSNVAQIDSFGRVIRKYPSFEQFSGKNNLRKIFNYVKDSEKMGKANLVYSVYKLNLCKKVWDFYPLGDEWGSDFCFILATLSRSNLCIDGRVLFQKRTLRDCDQQKFVSEIKVINPHRHIFPLDKSFEYIKNNLKAVKGTRYFFIVLIIMISRMPQVFLNSFLNTLNGAKLYIKNRVKKWRKAFHKQNEKA